MKKSLPFFIFLFLISCLGQMSSDLYLPALPTMRDFFQVSEHIVQLSLAIYMLGFSLSHLVYGSISDYVGRKNPLIVGLGICLAGTLLCQLSHHIDALMIGRFLQGAGAGAGAALFLSILSDVYQGNALAKISSFFIIARVILLASSPLVGSYLLYFFGWRACFTFLFFYTVICFLGSIFIFKETHLTAQPQTVSFSRIAKTLWILLTHPVFMCYAFCVMLAFGGILAWLTILPFLLQDVVGLTPIQFGSISAVAGLFFIIGGCINALWVEKMGFQKMLKIGLIIMLIGGAIMLAFGVSHVVNTIVIILPVIIYITGSSLIFSNAYAGAMQSFSNVAGAAGAVFGFLQILGGAMASFFMSMTSTYNQIPLSLALLLSAALALVVVRRQRTVF